MFSSQNNIRNYEIDNLPFVNSKNQTQFMHLCYYMLLLSKTEEYKESQKPLIEFFDKNVIDSLIYELYFADEFKVNLVDIVSPYLIEILNLDSYSGKLDVIKEVYNNLINDKEIINLINKIKSHPWIQMIEESSS